MSNHEGEIEKLNASIAALEAQRATLGDALVDPALVALKAQLSALTEDALGKTHPDERKLVTILFSDVSGFTALSEKLDPEEVRKLINDCFDSLVPIVQKYEGTIDKFIGDEIMALFGAPVAHEDDPERALRAALDMMEAVAEFNRNHNTTLGMHIGINTGRVVAGAVGAKGRRDYSVMGDAVNLAARLEAASDEGEIFVGPNTYRATSKLFNFERVPPLKLKGKDAPVDVHRLISGKSERLKVRGIEGLHAPLTGRDEELDLIRQSLLQLAQGEGCILSILGEAGLGKSRLIAEMREIASPKMKWSEGRALSYTTGRSYWIARDLTLRLLKVANDAGSTTVGEALRRTLDYHFANKTDDFYPYLARMLGLPLEEAMEERVKFLSGDALQARIFEAFREYIRAEASESPLILIWEDVHWSDPSSLQLLEQIAPLVMELPLMIVCASRTDESDPVKLLARVSGDTPGNSLRIELQPLSPDESSTLVHALLKIRDLPSQMRELIVQRAEGNPFYIEELLRSLIDNGSVVIEPTGPKLIRPVESVDVPETLQEVLAARIDRLQPEQKATLQKASVIGRIFNRTVLLQLHSGNGLRERLLDRILDELEQRQFVQSHSAKQSEAASLQENEYIFKHAITHEVAYQSLLLATRKELHGATAYTLEMLFPNRLDELSPLLGHHFQHAEIHQPAAFYLTRAAERAQAAFANDEALLLYRSALQQIGKIDAAERDTAITNLAARLHESTGDVLALMAKHSEARQAYGSARSYIANPDAVRRSRLFRKIGFTHNTQRHYEKSAQALDAANAELSNAADRSGEWWEEHVQIQLDRMHLLYWQGKAADMRALANNVRPVVEKRGAPIQRGRFFEKLALSQLTGSRFQPGEECLKLAKLAVSESDGSSNLSEVAHIRFVLGFVHLWRSNFSDAVIHFERALEGADRCGDLVTQARCFAYLTVAHRRAGELEQAQTAAQRALKVAARVEMIEYVAMAEANLAWVAWKEGRLEDCDSLGREALDLWHGMDDPYSFDWMALWPLIATALARKQTKRAVELAAGLFLESQHPLNDEVMSAIKRAIESRNQNNPAATAQMDIALETAKRHHYV